MYALVSPACLCLFLLWKMSFQAPEHNTDHGYLSFPVASLPGDTFPTQTQGCRSMFNPSLASAPMYHQVPMWGDVNRALYKLILDFRLYKE